MKETKVKCPECSKTIYLYNSKGTCQCGFKVFTQPKRDFRKERREMNEYEVRTKMTIRDAVTMYPDLYEETVEMVEHTNDAYYPTKAVFQFKGDGNYRTGELTNRYQQG